MSNIIPLSKPSIHDDDLRAVEAVLRSGRLSIGPATEQFESMLSSRIGRSEGVAVSSGTAGLHLILEALGVGPGDEVITPAFSFVASANCVEHAGGTPIFVDCDPRTLNINASEVEACITERTKAIIGVEVFGNPTGMRELAALSAKYEIPLVEDACEGIGGRLDDDPIGSFGRAAVFAFYPNKQITTGEGGMIVTDDERLANACRSMRNQGRAAADRSAPGSKGTTLDVERLGWNYRMSELHAALGVSQLGRLDWIMEQRSLVASYYTQALADVSDLIIPSVEPNVSMSWFVYVPRLTAPYTHEDRDEIIDGLRRHDIGAASYFPAIPQFAHFREKYGFKPGQFPMAESLSQRTIALPMYVGLTETEVQLIAQTLDLMMTRTRFRHDD
ncbi:MAG: DegT/DnrJ/EryC1/StrS family aminotransferase [Phycisphaerales bacterium]|nr:DegT/DnrJ/EryC1/StrS family aminotransferase [Phycisphaerales bacterium]